MGAVHVLDNYYLFITFLITIVYFYRIHVVNSTSSPILLAEQTLYFLRSSLRPSAAALVMLTISLYHCLSWSGRPLSGFLLFRIPEAGEGDRFGGKWANSFPF